MSYLNPPKNKEIFNEEYVIRVAINNLHIYHGIINPELFLLRKRKDKDEESLSVVVEKELESSENIRELALKAVPLPKSNPNIERTAIRLNVGELRKLLIGVSHSPSRNNSHGSLHGYFDISKSNSIIEISEELKIIEFTNYFKK